ncbi:hypothetical protein BGI15_02845 [Snodgrassella alvi]|uniref:hypothetical protein n=1 Tax=Snodgrassella TaxID=1193515 RepID=UPI000A054869|nr:MULTISPECIES: hypothetical protein [Snodgrassella]MBI0165146.1 hypothetical protein [Snodgrassella sp. M0351]ORF25332.1 hypothetical protein BGI07_05590 [Snodgrassella alvi]ORF30687.1 hypothetical protein BGI10_07400 [Snodgrassella alvi]ORF34230.1 hypothetical protein BGI11_05955 [Snodgrassella alvi]ORF38744.1 hypothetical protein BGI14_08615 [Snodgrassella alvi]
MKKTILFLILLYSALVQAEFIHPMDYDGSQEQKKAVKQFIKQQVQHDYCQELNICNASALRKMEKKNFRAFMKTTHATDRKVMDEAIDHCMHYMDMCEYSIIELKYSDIKKSEN